MQEADSTDVESNTSTEDTSRSDSDNSNDKIMKACEKLERAGWVQKHVGLGSDAESDFRHQDEDLHTIQADGRKLRNAEIDGNCGQQSSHSADNVASQQNAQAHSRLGKVEGTKVPEARPQEASPALPDNLTHISQLGSTKHLRLAGQAAKVRTADAGTPVHPTSEQTSAESEIVCGDEVAAASSGEELSVGHPSDQDQVAGTVQQVNQPVQIMHQPADSFGGAVACHSPNEHLLGGPQSTHRGVAADTEAVPFASTTGSTANVEVGGRPAKRVCMGT